MASSKRNGFNERAWHPLKGMASQEILENSQENTCARASVFVKLQA